VKLLLEREYVDPNRPDEDNQTPLGCAAAKGHEGVIKLLLGREDVNPNHLGMCRTPLGLAAVRGHEGVVKLLLGWEDVDPNCSDEDGQTRLGCAAAEGHEGVIRLLLGRSDGMLLGDMKGWSSYCWNGKAWAPIHTR